MSMFQRLEALERRLDAIEKHFRVPPEKPASIEPPTATVAPAPVEPSEATVVPETASVPFAILRTDEQPIPPPADTTEPFIASDDLIAEVQQSVGVGPEPSKSRGEKCEKLRRFFKDQKQRFVPQAPAAPTSARSPFKLEQAIGLKWSGWIGAIVLVVGAAMGVQFAYENHWFAHLPPAFRLAMIFAVGIALLIAGEFVLRRVHQVPAASLFGAGIAVLFLGSYAGYAYFDLYSRSISMVLMGGSTLIGAAVAMRGNLVSIAALSLIGANVTPILVATPNAPVLPFLFYLLMMLIVALTLAAWGRGGKWWLLRGLSLCPTVAWMWCVLDSPQGHDSAVLGYMIVYAALYHAELILTAIRHAPKSADASSEPRHAAIGTTFALCVTTALALGLLKYLDSAGDTERAGCAILLSILSAALGVVLPRAHPALQKLAVSHRIAAAALLVAAVPLYTGGVRLEIAWMLMALGFAVSWRVTRSRISRVAAPVTWLLGFGKLCFVVIFAMSFSGGSPWGETWLVIRGTAIGANLILAWLFALCGQLMAALIFGEDGPAPRWLGGREVGALCGLVWIVASIAALPHLGATTAILAYAWVLRPFDRIVPSLGLALQAGTSLLIAIVKWAAVDTLAARLSPAWTTTTPVFNSLTGVGALLAASLLAFYRLFGNSLWPPPAGRRSDDRGDEPLWNLIIVSAAIVLMTISFSFEIDRVVARAMIPAWSDPLPAWQVRQLSFTILWSVSIAVLAMAVARLAPAPLAGTSRRVIWVLILLLSAKFIFLDSLAAYFDTIKPLRPILNLQILAGSAIVACLVAMRWIAPSSGSDTPNGGWAVGLLAALLIAWMGTLEIDRAFGRFLPSAEPYGVAWHLKQLAWTVWWTLVATATLLTCRRLDKLLPPTALWLRELPIVLGLIASKHLCVDMLFWRESHALPAGWNVLLNWDVLTTAIVLGGAWLPNLLRLPSAALGPGRRLYFRVLATSSTVTLLLVAGLMEVDRAFALPGVRQAVNDPELAEQVALSIYLAAFAIFTLSVGFWKHSAPLRYTGLVILGAALLKVVIVDLSQVRYGYRILSFLGLGVILLITSVMYGKITPRLLQQTASKREE